MLKLKRRLIGTGVVLVLISGAYIGGKFSHGANTARAISSVMNVVTANIDKEHIISQDGVKGAIENLDGEITAYRFTWEKENTYIDAKWYGVRSVTMTVKPTFEVKYKLKDVEVNVDQKKKLITISTPQPFLDGDSSFEHAVPDNEITIFRSRFSAVEIQAIFDGFYKVTKEEAEKQTKEIQTGKDKINAQVYHMVHKLYPKATIVFKDIKPNDTKK